MGLGLNKLLDFSKCIHPKVCILQCFGMNKLLGQILAVGRAIRTKSLSLFVLFVADYTNYHHPGPRRVLVRLGWDRFGTKTAGKPGKSGKPCKPDGTCSGHARHAGCVPGIDILLNMIIYGPYMSTYVFK